MFEENSEMFAFSTLSVVFRLNKFVIQILSESQSDEFMINL